MKYATVCSGVEAPTVAWHSLKFEPVWFSEIEPFPCKVLNYHYPQVPNLGDMTKLNEHETYRNTTIDLLCGGTPCQSFSIAGLRGGLDDERGNLALEFARILLRKQPRWFIWENVPGVFSSFTNETESPVWVENGQGNGDNEVFETADFAAILNGFRECGYSCAYRVLDAQYFGVPQRRRRVFVVGYLGNNWRAPYAVLFERDSLRRDFTPGREKGKETAGKIGANTKNEIGTLTRQYAEQSGQDDDINLAVIDALAYSIQTGQTGANGSNISIEVKPVLTKNDKHAVAYDTTQITSPQNGSNPTPELCHPLCKGQHVPLLTLSASTINSIARRLTPLECERLQGFPDNYTAIPGAKDGPRYAAIGNSMAVPVMKWIGERIQMVDNILKNLKDTQHDRN